MHVCNSPPSRLSPKTLPTGWQSFFIYAHVVLRLGSRHLLSSVSTPVAVSSVLTSQRYDGLLSAANFFASIMVLLFLEPFLYHVITMFSLPVSFSLPCNGCIWHSADREQSLLRRCRNRVASCVKRQTCRDRLSWSWRLSRLERQFLSGLRAFQSSVGS